MKLQCHTVLRPIRQHGRPVSRIVLRNALAQSLHSSPAKPANPVNHPPAPGPPPKVPVPEPSVNDERVARKKKQAELLERGRSLRVNPAKPATALQKRFWKEVKVERTAGKTKRKYNKSVCSTVLEGYQIHLDARPVRTPSKGILTIPLSKPHLATAIALEWDLLVSAQQAQKQHYIPLTSLTSRALDIAKADQTGDERVRENIVKMLMNYLTTDTLLCWAPETKDPSNPSRKSLRSHQKAVAQPIMDFLSGRIWPGAELRPAMGEDSILLTPQPDATIQVIRGWISGLPAWELAALERGALASKSLCVAVRLLVEWSERWKTGAPINNQNMDSTAATTEDATKEEKFTIEDAAEACSLEVRWQTGMWGEVEDTHDVEKEDIRRQLGSVVLLVTGSDS